MPKHKFTGFLDDLSPDQLKAFKEFKALVEKEGLADLSSPRYDDCELLRFMRARKFKVKKVAEMFRKYINWRKEKDVDNKIYFQFPELEQILSVYPHGYHKTDRAGRPVYIERVGLLNLNEIFKITTEERLVEYYIREYEKLILYRYPELTRIGGRKIEQGTTILDCKHGSMKIMTKKVYSFIKLASQIAQDYYPEILAQMFLVNAPVIFTMIWAVVRGFIDEKTRKKIKIMGSKYKKTLHAAVDPANLPVWLGGEQIQENEGDLLRKETGPWMDALSKHLGEAGEIIDHAPKLEPRYLGDSLGMPPPPIEEVKDIEADGIAVGSDDENIGGLGGEEEAGGPEAEVHLGGEEEPAPGPVG